MQIEEASDMKASDMEAVAVGNTVKFGEVWGGICFFQLLLNLGPGYTPHIGLLGPLAIKLFIQIYLKYDHYIFRHRRH